MLSATQDELIQEYFDGELPDGNREVENLLAELPEARQFHESLAQLAIVLSQLDLDEPPLDLGSSIMAEVRTATPSQPATRFARSLWLYAALLVVGVGLGQLVAPLLDRSLSPPPDQTVGTLVPPPDQSARFHPDFNASYDLTPTESGFDLTINLGLDRPSHLHITLEQSATLKGFTLLTGELQSASSRPDQLDLALTGSGIVRVHLGAAASAGGRVQLRSLNTLLFDEPFQSNR